MRFITSLVVAGFIALQSSATLSQETENSPAPEREPSAATQQEAPDNVTAAAVFYTCKDYFEHKFNSAARENVGRKSSCVSYFFGVGSTLLQLDYEDVELGFCMPEVTSTEDLIKLYIEWLPTHEERSKDIATAVLLDALKDTYPCDATVPLGASD